MAIAVIDTNVILDWFVFRDPTCAALAEAIESGQLRWMASRWMRGELEHVVGRGLGGRWPVDWPTLAARWDRWVVEAPQPDAMPHANRLRCTDPLDQPFIDLAVTVGARWLVSRDRAVLKLARRAHPLGLHILSPSAWPGLAAQSPTAA
jgi:predicted nucleic acid-binding protein